MPISFSCYCSYDSPTTYISRCDCVHRRTSGHYISYSRPHLFEVIRLIPTERETDHDYCRRKDSTYASLHRDLVKQREHKESIARRLQHLEHRFGSTERKEKKALYEDLREEVKTLEKRVEERKNVVLRR
ncbi:hypothetical protein LTR85_002653 [Meristemomyces frigidus]|nr:hypothetical protein LTR85_002653 [Meristemomyces frigidus]